MTTTAATHFGRMFAPGARTLLSLADGMLKDVPPQMFARKPEGVDCNTPAFIFGHLALYPETILPMLGRESDTLPDDHFKELFDHGNECEDDTDGSKYPPMDEIMERFRTRMNVAIDALEQADEQTLNAPNPSESMRDNFPTTGAMCEFLLNGHTAFHLGQVSTWRRCMGLGPAM